MNLGDEHVIEESAAHHLGYSPLTSEYSRSEGDMMAHVIADMIRGGIDWCLVRGRDGLAVWRKHMRKIVNYQG